MPTKDCCELGDRWKRMQPAGWLVGCGPRWTVLHVTLLADLETDVGAATGDIVVANEEATAVCPVVESAILIYLSSRLSKSSKRTVRWYKSPAMKRATW
jgi:hypothetical protein